MTEDAESSTARWLSVLDATALAPGALAEVRAGDFTLLLARAGDTVHALETRCPHGHVRFVDGRLDGEQLVCPGHGARFRLHDGVCEQGYTLPALKRYPVRVCDGQVQVSLTALERDPPGMIVRERWDLTRR